MCVYVRARCLCSYSREFPCKRCGSHTAAFPIPRATEVLVENEMPAVQPDRTQTQAFPHNPSWRPVSRVVACHTQGTVIIVANEGSVIMIPDGTVLRDSVITGNLRILDH